eukprot:TRINITY_DN8155_c0_g2_i1.p1 TRINITY_DN8155_c0_g2~~TRINITY_DN8155_c0_g2_i1.p1  ORF type:complete len:655 (+),score=171.93 TRINITY_DN8155_c0_g2_i1:157-2121(+)
MKRRSGEAGMDEQDSAKRQKTQERETDDGAAASTEAEGAAVQQRECDLCGGDEMRELERSQAEWRRSMNQSHLVEGAENQMDEGRTRSEGGEDTDTDGARVLNEKWPPQPNAICAQCDRTLCVLCFSKMSPSFDARRECPFCRTVLPFMATPDIPAPAPVVNLLSAVRNCCDEARTFEHSEKTLKIIAGTGKWTHLTPHGAVTPHVARQQEIACGLVGAGASVRECVPREVNEFVSGLGLDTTTAIHATTLVHHLLLFAVPQVETIALDLVRPRRSSNSCSYFSFVDDDDDEEEQEEEIPALRRHCGYNTTACDEVVNCDVKGFRELFLSSTLPPVLWEYCCRLQASSNALEFRSVKFNESHMQKRLVPIPKKHQVCVAKVHADGQIPEALQRFLLQEGDDGAGASEGMPQGMLALWSCAPSRDLLSFAQSLQRAAVLLLSLMCHHKQDVSKWTASPIHDFFFTWILRASCSSAPHHLYLTLLPAAMRGGFAKVPEHLKERAREEEKERLEKLQKKKKREEESNVENDENDDENDDEIDDEDGEDDSFDFFGDESEDEWMRMCTPERLDGFSLRVLDDDDMDELWSMIPDVWIGEERYTRSLMGDLVALEHAERARSIMRSALTHPDLWGVSWWHCGEPVKPLVQSAAVREEGA